MTDDEMFLVEKCIDHFKRLISETGDDFMNKNYIPIPGVCDSTELNFYVTGCLNVLSRLQEKISDIYSVFEG